ADASLVDADIDDDSAGAHRAHHRSCNELRGDAAGHEHRADQDICITQVVLEAGRAGDTCGDALAKLRFEAGQALEVSGCDRDTGAEGKEYTRGRRPDIAAADDKRSCRRGAGDATQQFPAPGTGLLEE